MGVDFSGLGIGQLDITGGGPANGKGDAADIKTISVFFTVQYDNAIRHKGRHHTQPLAVIGVFFASTAQLMRNIICMQGRGRDGGVEPGLEVGVKTDAIHVIVEGFPESAAHGGMIAFDGIDEGDFIAGETRFRKPGDTNAERLGVVINRAMDRQGKAMPIS